ncbi:MAG: DUF342 domain-containing protein [Spirochaetes bacterium]|nr:DUF342 domain-containing protein [Spirochaetota bacterium]
MKLIIFYFDYRISKIFKEQINAEGKTVKAIATSNNFVFRNEILAKIIEVEDQNEIKSHIDPEYNYYHVIKYLPFKSGEGVSYDDFTKTFRASEYGFVRFDKLNAKISVLSPLQITRDKTKAYFLIHPSILNRIPDFEDISEQLVKKNIYTILPKNEIDEKLGQIDVNIQKLYKILVAAGKEPANGNPEYFIPLINIEKKAGKILDNGSIDFKEIDSIIQIKQRQAILKRIPAKAPEDGFNIYGDKIPAIIESRIGYIKGKNIIPSEDDTVYVSEIDGCLSRISNIVSVLPVVVIKGDINYETGNIDFKGSVDIFGSVLPGFKVTASDNIVIRNNVDDATIQAGGNIIVHAGIGGKGSTKITAEGSVKAKYILNSTIEAKGDVTAEVSIINSNIYSNGRITVTDENGKIMGGETMSLNEVSAYTIGGPKENKTIITAGKNLIIENELNSLKMQLNIYKEEAEELAEYAKSMYGEELFMNTKKFLSILPEVKKKNCLLLLSKMAECNEKLKEKTQEYKETVERYTPPREPVITVFKDIFPGTIINIKKRTKHIERKYSNVKFFEDNEEKLIKFTYAV